MNDIGVVDHLLEQGRVGRDAERVDPFIPAGGPPRGGCLARQPLADNTNSTGDPALA